MNPRICLSLLLVLYLCCAPSSAQTLRQRARALNHHIHHYGSVDPTSVSYIKQHQLVVLHPTHFNASRQQIQQLQQGNDASNPADDLLVLCYVSIGEDLRTAGLNDAQFAADSRFRGNGQGPRVDPRGPYASGQPLTGLDPMGAPSPGGLGWASYYLDDNSVYLGQSVGTGGLGWPDRNQIFNGAFVNPGDPAWFDTVRNMRYDSADRLFGIDELLTTWVGRGLGCDGLFLDTFDTAAPNSYTDGTSPNMSKFEWTAAGFRLFLQRLRNAFPDKVLLQNRGLFFMDPRFPHYQVTTRGYPDLLLFESFRLDSNGGYNANFYPDNRFNYAPKIMAEANRADTGFRVLSLGYVAGSTMSTETLFGRSTYGIETMLEDIRITEMETGMRHYMTNGMVDLANNFVVLNSNTSKGPGWDVQPPHWTSTYNPNPQPPTEPPPRVGIQKVVAQTGSVQVYWDVALDLNDVDYVVYYQTWPFDWSSATPLAGAIRVGLYPSQPWDYAGTWNTYPYYATVTGLTGGTTYYFLIRAVDRSPQRNEDWNSVVLSATVLGSGGTVPTAPPPSPPPPPPAGGTGIDGSPFGGTLAPIPGRIECENYDIGGAGIAYWDSTPGNQGGAYRTDDVDIEVASEAGYDVTNTADGEVIEFAVQVAATRAYNLEIRVSSDNNNGQFHLEVDYVTVLPVSSVLSTGGKQIWTTLTATGPAAIYMTAGRHIIRLVIDRGGANYNWFSLL